jgi:type II secretory pathway component PulK
MTVLWIVLIIAFISFSLAAAARVEVTATQNTFDAERAFFMAKGTAEVVFQSLQKPETLDKSPVHEEKGVYTFPFDSGQARVELESSGGFIDINSANDKLLASMFDSLGVDNLLRNELVDSILDWRDADDVPRPYGAEISEYGKAPTGSEQLPRNGGFEGVEELLLVKHMPPQIFYGQVQFDATTNTHRKVPGVRDLITVNSRQVGIDVNGASVDVLAAVPGIAPSLAEAIVAERSREPFKNPEDLAKRIPELQDNEASKYLSTEKGPATSLVSIATIQPSGISRTVRLNFTRERKKQILLLVPFFYKDVEVIKVGRWEY